MTSDRMNRLPGLTELRAIAALCVIPGHIEALKPYYGMTPYYWFPVPGKIGVVLFFALSGFLITTLLHREYERSGRINLRSFYVKRALRIWPLYFFVMGISLLLLNRVPYFMIPGLSDKIYSLIGFEEILLIIFILPNYLLVIIPYASQSWSIGIEEQFYLLYPLLLRAVRSVATLLFVLIAIVALPDLVHFLPKSDPTSLYSIGLGQAQWFSTVAIGCIAALCASYRMEFIIKLAQNTFILLICIALLVWFFYRVQHTGNEYAIDFRLYAVLFSLIIINLGYGDRSWLGLAPRFARYLGEISYGIYMYHTLAIIIVLQSTPYLFGDGMKAESIAENVLIYLLTITLTVFVSSVSYRILELPFLGLKRHYALQPETIKTKRTVFD